MPRVARLDASGVLQHIMTRGIEGRNIFADDADRDDLLFRLARLPPRDSDDLLCLGLDIESCPAAATANRNDSLVDTDVAAADRLCHALQPRQRRRGPLETYQHFGFVVRGGSLIHRSEITE